MCASWVLGEPCHTMAAMSMSCLRGAYGKRSESGDLGNGTGKEEDARAAKPRPSKKKTDHVPGQVIEKPSDHDARYMLG